MWFDLFYDKFAKNNYYNNELTKGVIIDDFNDVSYTSYTNEQAYQFFHKKFPDEDRLPKFLIKSSMYKLYCYTKYVNDIETIFTVVSINSTILKNLIRYKKDIPNKEFLKKLLFKHYHHTKTNREITSTFYNKEDTIIKIDGNINYVITTVTKPVDYIMDEEINDPIFINDTIKLFKYQKASIYWMLQKERGIAKIRIKKEQKILSRKELLQGSIIKYNLNPEVVIKNIYYDIGKHTYNYIHNRDELAFFGGGLIDEVGLGKTIQMIALSKLNPSTAPYISKIDKTKLYSKATLVLCPNHLCGQWARELKNRLSDKDNTNVINIMTKTHFNKYTHYDILNADFVILSYTFLDNNAFVSKWIPELSKSCEKII